MSRIEYDLAQKDHPELSLPDWMMLNAWQQNVVYKVKREILIRERREFLLTKNPSDKDWIDNP